MTDQEIPEPSKNGYIYDKATLQMLTERRKEYLADKSILSPIEKAMARIQLQRKKNGLFC